jgi:very-short-patch-repair endonuclease
MTTLQYALKRGIESVYQLEESELMAEPLPGRDLRQSILFFEAAEGGAGVLTRIATETEALRAVAAEALEIMHFNRPAEGHPWKKTDLTQETDDHGQPICEAGCYKCLLSYYNQPDHLLIDRQDHEADGLVLDILCRLTQSDSERDSIERTTGEPSAELEELSTSNSQKAWLAYVEEHGYLKPGRAQHELAAVGVYADFFYEDFNLVVFIDDPHHANDSQRAKDAVIDQRLEDLAFIVVRFSEEPESWPTVFAANADLFGPGKKD